MTRPNILFVMTDDQTVGEMSCYGNALLPTPNMGRIASGGTRFANCFATNALCAPSRATVLTGCLSHIHGIRGNQVGQAGLTEPWLLSKGIIRMFVLRCNGHLPNTDSTGTDSTGTRTER